MIGKRSISRRNVKDTNPTRYSWRRSPPITDSGKSSFSMMRTRTRTTDMITGNTKGPEITLKFLATAMEALLGAYYLDHKTNRSKRLTVVRRWMEIIDSCTELCLGNHEHGLASKIFTRTLGFKHGGVISEYNSMNLCFFNLLLAYCSDIIENPYD